MEQIANIFEVSSQGAPNNGSWYLNRSGKIVTSVNVIGGQLEYSYVNNSSMQREGNTGGIFLASSGGFNISIQAPQGYTIKHLNATIYVNVLVNNTTEVKEFNETLIFQTGTNFTGYIDFSSVYGFELNHFPNGSGVYLTIVFAPITHPTPHPFPWWIILVIIGIGAAAGGILEGNRRRRRKRECRENEARKQTQPPQEPDDVLKEGDP